MSHTSSEISGFPPALLSVSPPTLPEQADRSVDDQPAEPLSERHISLSLPGWLLSSLLHLAIILILAMLSFPDSIGNGGFLVIGEQSGEDEGTQLENLESPAVPETSLPAVQVDAASVEQLASVAEEAQQPSPELETANPLIHEMSPLSDIGLSTNQLVEDPGHGMNVSGLSGRQGPAKEALLASGGGSPGTEEAVQRALRYLANHQNENGSWQFDMGCECHDQGALSGESVSATALTLLAFLGAGNTHEEGEYREFVKKALYFLRQAQGGDGGFLEPHGGQIYAHALASIALCEAYTMTQDRGLRGAAQRSLDYISDVRDPHGGGWRYVPQEPGDTSVTGWIIMALKSGRLGYLSIPNETVQGAKSFLEQVASNNGSTYGYQGPGDGAATSAVGLLCRMYMGWSHDNPALQRGVELLAKQGPSKDDIYYDYYATQVMRHFGGSAWVKWNQKMRGILVSSQQRYGHSAGSWIFPRDKGALPGGRLYSTVMATMILEVYYRHLPIYGDGSSGDHFPL